MRTATFTLVFAALSATGFCSPGIAQVNPSDWHVYTNTKYGYEIRYPEGLEVLATGLEAERDGRSIRISRKEYAAPTPMLLLSVGSDAAATELPAGDVKGMTVIRENILVGSTPARQVTWRWTENGEIAFLEVALPGARFLFHANAGVVDIRETLWWRIIETFRNTDR